VSAILRYSGGCGWVLAVLLVLRTREKARRTEWEEQEGRRLTFKGARSPEGAATHRKSGRNPLRLRPRREENAAEGAAPLDLAERTGDRDGTYQRVPHSRSTAGVWREYFGSSGRITGEIPAERDGELVEGRDRADDVVPQGGEMNARATTDEWTRFVSDGGPILLSLRMGECARSKGTWAARHICEVGPEVVLVGPYNVLFFSFFFLLPFLQIQF
jgi:hypothetical protein